MNIYDTYYRQCYCIANYCASYSAYRHTDVDDKQKYSTKTVNTQPATHSPLKLNFNVIKNPTIYSSSIIIATYIKLRRTARPLFPVFIYGGHARL